MKHVETQLSAFLLAQIEWELQRISERQHELARRKAVLRERATRLRLGASPAELDLTVRQTAARGGLASVNQLRSAPHQQDRGEAARGIAQGAEHVISWTSKGGAT